MCAFCIKLNTLICNLNFIFPNLLVDFIAFLLVMAAPKTHPVIIEGWVLILIQKLYLDELWSFNANICKEKNDQQEKIIWLL